MKVSCKSPLSGYYGGKARLGKKFAEIIRTRDFNTFVEPFAGGSSVTWALASDGKLRGYVINDINGAIINFYRQAKEHKNELVAYAQARNLCSRELHGEARKLYDKGAADIPTAWAVWYLTKTARNGDMRGTFGLRKVLYDGRTGLSSVRGPCDDLESRLQLLQRAIIEKRDAMYILERYDDTNTFFYLDPPYVGAHQAHYGGYEQENFNNLLEALSGIKGWFALSSYENERLVEMTELHGWRRVEFDVSAPSTMGHTGRRVEILTMNFDERKSWATRKIV